MRALVVYESMFGNTHEIAECVAAGLRVAHEVTVVAASEATAADAATYDLLVVGAPTHAHGLPGASSRQSAEDMASKDDGLELDVDVSAPGVREWLDSLGERDHAHAAAFDTRVDGPALVMGRASRGIAKRLSRHGFDLVMGPESFLVDRHNQLREGEADRASEWGRALAYLGA